MLANSLQKNSSTVLYVFVALGFAFVLLELLILGHTRGGQLISIIACALGIILAVAGMAAAGARKIIAILFVVLALTGLMGFMAHSDGRSGRAAATVALPASDDRTLQRAVRSFSGLPPTLSPLILSGLALFGAAVTLMASANPQLAKMRA